jgi:hypothetical protein
MSRRLGSASALASIGCVACQSFVGEYAPDLAETSADSARLCQVERDAFAFALDLESGESMPSLEDYYEAANPELIDRLSAVATAYREGVEQTSVTYVLGAAGVGKSFVTRNSFDQFAEAEQCTIELGTLFREEAATLNSTVVEAPDLATLDDAVVFNQLPALEAPDEVDFVDLLRAGGCFVDGALLPLIVLDGIDEVHDATSTAILAALDGFVLDGMSGEGLHHFVVAGRPEGFWSWLTDPGRTEENNAIVARFDLEAPMYRSAGDLEFRVLGYLDFAGRLEDLEASGGVDAYVQSFIDAVATHPFLTYSVGNLAVGNVVAEHTAPGLGETEEELKSGLFDDIVFRNSQTHGRPGADGEYADAYRRALEDVATRYVEVNTDGTFAVRSEDRVDITAADGSVLGQVQVRSLLNRGGVAFLTSASATTTRYRFDPFWLHAHLVERRNARLTPGYAYRTCE